MATVVISVDAELAWGSHDFERVPTDRVAAAREGWRTLLDHFDRYEVPATWAVVGHLFLSDCDGEHAEHPSLEGWFDADPGGPASASPRWFADGLLEAVADSPVAHDVGGHSFSHRQLNPDLDPEIARAEVEATVTAARDRGFDLASFVHPGNVIGHRDVLADCGFTCYRGRPPTRPSDGTVLQPARKLLSGAVGGDPRLVEPAVDDHDLVNVPASLYLFDVDGGPSRALGRAGIDPVVGRAKRGVDAAADRDGVYHLWLHPNNLVSPHDVERVERVLEYVDAVRARTDLTVETMASVADRVAAETAAPTPTTP
jgi:peptidoglycan/xylan/chitin deacetylase (PgdA/CDA1 family)